MYSGISCGGIQGCKSENETFSCRSETENDCNDDLNGDESETWMEKEKNFF